jgi:hypothetical protein
MHPFRIVLFSLVAICAPIYGCIVTVNSSLNIRNAASTTATVVGSLKQGETVKCLEKFFFCRVGAVRWVEYIDCAKETSVSYGKIAPKADYTRKTWCGVKNKFTYNSTDFTRRSLYLDHVDV